MSNVKISPLLVAALIITSMTWALEAYESYASHDISLGIIYTVLFVFMVTLVVWAIVRNKNIKADNEQRD